MTSFETALYAPQVRLIDLATGKIIGATRGSPTASAAIAPDVVSAKVTLTNTGVGQVQLTLNNQRFIAGINQPPVWKYNGFRKPIDRGAELADGLGDLGFGQLIRVDFRYGDGTWIKMIVAQVNDLKFSFPASGGAQVQVIGEDLLCRFKVKPSQDHPYSNKQEEELVDASIAHVFAGVGDRPGLAPGSVTAAQQGRTQPLRSVRHQKATTYFQFITDLAERLNFELFMEFKDVRAARTSARTVDVAGGPVTLASELQVHFEQARSQRGPRGERRAGTDLAGEDELAELHYQLRWGKNLIEFTPTFKVYDMPTQAEAFGTNHGARARSSQRLTPTELTSLMTAELPASDSYPGVTPRHAVDARRDYFGDTGAGAENNQSTAGSNLDGPRLKLKAGAEFLKKVREFMTADGQTLGLPRLRPGQYLDIVGLRPPFDGYYYVTRTVHSLDSSGYKTQFTVRRPGMLPPENYLPPPAAPPPAAGPDAGAGDAP
ncbi:MAG: hypothetical protein R3B06_04690 [Kofleriaceae bacterium]